MLSQLQSSISSRLQDENYPPHSDPRFPAPSLPTSNLGADRPVNSHGLTLSSAPWSPHRYPNTGTHGPNPVIPIQPSNDLQEQDKGLTSPVTQPNPLQSGVPGSVTTAKDNVMSCLPAPDANDPGRGRDICEADHAGRHHRGGLEPEASMKEQSSEQDDSQRTFQLHTLLKDAEPEVLESGVQQGLRLLQDLKPPLTRASDNPDTSEWLKQIGT